ncbi:MAG: glycosyltransferase family 39 protein [Planctomycetota bacterium]
MRVAFTLLALALLAFWPRIDYSEWRGTEARRVQIAAEMAESGDWLVPTLGQEPTWAKPPLHYWVLMALLQLGDDQALLRLPSIAAFWGLALVAFAALQRAFSTLSAWCGALGILLSPTVMLHMPTAEIDPLFAALTGVSIILLAEGACFRENRRVALAGLVGGLALLCKGPPYLLFLAGTLLVWGRRLGFAGALWFVPALVAPPLAYVLAVFTLRGGSSDIVSVAGEESVGRLVLFSWESVVDLPAYAGRVLVMLMPLGWWTFHEYRGDREMRETVVGREEALLRMCAAAMVGAAFLLALFPSRPGRYLLPGVPLFLMALSPAVASYARHGTSASRVLARVVHGIAVIACIGLLAAPWLPFPYCGRTPLLCFALAAAPLWVQTRRQVAIYAAVIPLLTCWTYYVDRDTRDQQPTRSWATTADIVERELRALGVASGDLATAGHVHSQIVLGLDFIPPGDELFRREPTARFLLVEHSDARDGQLDPARLTQYHDRVRLRVHDRSIVIKERRD